VGVWTVILIAVAAVVIFLGANLLLPVHFVFSATFCGTQFEYDARLRLPLIPWYIRIPKTGAGRSRRSGEKSSRSAGKSGEQPSFGAQGKEQPTGNTPQSTKKPSGTKAGPAHERLGAIWRAVQAFRSFYRKISGVVLHVARTVTVEDFRLDVTLGLDEAAETALLTGALQSAASVWIGLLCRHGVRFSRRPRIRVTPAYNRLCLEGGVRVQTSVIMMQAIIALGRLRSHLMKMNARAGTHVRVRRKTRLLLRRGKPFRVEY
jgi:hypothetical protein